MDRLLTVQEAAAALGCSTGLVYKLTSTKKIAFYKVGAGLRFTEAHLMGYLSAREVAAGSEPGPGG